LHLDRFDAGFDLLAKQAQRLQPPLIRHATGYTISHNGHDVHKSALLALIDQINKKVIWSTAILALNN